jgi:hypothetical protein
LFLISLRQDLDVAGILREVAGPNHIVAG